MTKILVDGREIDVPGDYTLLQACEAAGAEIPRFCYHERLSIAGNCRMCLIEVKVAGRSGPKPVASCAQQVRDLPPPKPDQAPPELVTRSDVVRKAREGVMEFLLINHPLDCPICDQGGECDLQDQSLAYGRASSRFDENKRAVEEKFMGPLIKTVMTRCIQCTRCVRFAAEIAGAEEIGAAGRGEDMEITTYLEQAVQSELSGNVIDLCPVGALTSKPYAFSARPWELKKTETIDVMDAVGSNIRVDARGAEVLRVLPRLNEEINEEWISDKTRYACDGLKRQRLDRAYARRDGRLAPIAWPQALALAAERLSGDPARIGAIAGDLASLEGMKALKDLLDRLGVVNMDCRQDGAALSGQRQSYLFNTTILGLEDVDALLLVGTNPRWEAPLVNARIRKTWLRGALSVGRIGPPVDLTYEVAELGAGAGALSDLTAGAGNFFDVLKNARNPALIVGQGALTRPDGAQVLRACADIAAATGMVRAGADPWNGFNVLHTAAARVGGLDLGFLPGQGGKGARAMAAGGVDTLILLGADEIDLAGASDAFVIYVGSHGDAGAARADLILPAAAFTEQNGLYVNTEGRVQMSVRSVFAKADAREEWAIFRALSERGHTPLGYDSLEDLRAALVREHPVLGGLDYAPGAATAEEFDLAGVGAPGPLAAADFVYPISDFYLTNPIARASRTMAECSRTRRDAAAAPAAAAE